MPPALWTSQAARVPVPHVGSFGCPLLQEPHILPVNSLPGFFFFFFFSFFLRATFSVAEPRTSHLLYPGIFHITHEAITPQLPELRSPGGWV